MKSLLLLTVALSFSAFAGTKSPTGEEFGKTIILEKLTLSSQYKDSTPAQQAENSKEAEEYARATCESKGLMNCEIIGTTRQVENGQSVYTTEVQADDQEALVNELEELENKF